MCGSNKGVDAQTEAEARGGNPAPSGSDCSDRPGDLLEQRATGGKQGLCGSCPPGSFDGSVYLGALCSQHHGQNIFGDSSQVPRSLVSQ